MVVKNERIGRSTNPYQKKTQNHIERIEQKWMMEEDRKDEI